jgi:folate-binding protein YgfZ
MHINISTFPGIWWWRPAALLQVTGPDAANFLQGQFTNDLRDVVKSDAVYGLWLTVKGKVLADSFVGAKGSEGFCVASYQSEASIIRGRLESFIIADDVTVEDQTSRWSAVSVIGPAAEELIRTPVSGGWVFRGRRAHVPGVEWIFPVEMTDEVRRRLGTMRELTADDMTRWRIASALPAVPTEIGPNDLPNEGGLDEGAISYTKGCYLGQEVMARLKSMGHVRRRLLRVHAASAAVPATPAPLFAGGRNVGELRSAVGDGAGGTVGFAMLSLTNLAADSELSLSGGEPAAFRLLDRDIVKP